MRYILLTVYFSGAMIQASSQDGFTQRNNQLIDSIWINKNGLNTWITCSSGNLFYQSDTVHFFRNDYNFYPDTCGAFLRCSFTDKFDVDIIMGGKILSAKQHKEIQSNPHGFFNMQNKPKPDSVVFRDTLQMGIEYVQHKDGLIINLFKYSSLYYSLKVVSLEEYVPPGTSHKIQRLTAVKYIF